MTQSQIRLDNRMSLQLNSGATNLRITKLKMQDAGTLPLSCHFRLRVYLKLPRLAGNWDKPWIFIQNKYS